ncbi:hypothetical protein N657DRAFT_687950 [Parathielavia appendiculata]|uniref:Telomeric single stranded DNA binding POT1/Cdc13 domain-containing protein n=1 Tax=Parathielavia appendiculata TaxID=2587402 RepID=A0AAN6U7L0_9PEZI|nr:hypothetical protein N657DRAFT_687950 [Parathielavia appendiculata]
MAAVNGDSAAMLASKIQTPIAQLNPELPDQASRAVRGEITITWPYNSVTKRLAFLIAEPDVRLRRAKGQIRIELQGPSAKTASELGLGAGDELLFSLDGAEWSKDESPGRIPGARVEWQLQFDQNLNLQVKFGESGEVKHINIDHPAPELPDGQVADAPMAATPDPEPSVPEIPTTVRKISDLPLDEYPSPAFVKRARLSYGTLFEGGFDIFEEDGGIKRKGRKRTRFGRDSGAWRYSSQSPNREPTSPGPDAMEEDVPRDASPQPSPKPQMMDEGCQTVEVDMQQAPDIVDAVLSQLETTPTPAPPQHSAGAVGEERTTIRGADRVSVSSVPEEEPNPGVSTQRLAPFQDEPPSTSGSDPDLQRRERSPSKSVKEGPAAAQPSTTVLRTSPPSKSASGTVASTLSGPKSLSSSFLSFGASAPARVQSSLSLSDQVRFSFSHIPQTARSPSPAVPEPAPEPDHHEQDRYPASYLDDAPAPAKFADMNTYLNAADEDNEMVVHGQTVPPHPPAVERFADGQWEMLTQPSQYNLLEGGHFDTDALEERARVMAGQASLHAYTVTPDRAPDGFASYGHKDVSERHQGNSSRQAPLHEDESLVEHKDTVSGDEIDVDEEEDEDVKSDEYAYGEQIEEGDYDQRNYENYSDDEEGLSEEDDEVEMEAEERYGNGEMYDEDGEGEEWDEEGDYESDEDDYDEEDEEMEGYHLGKPAAPAPSGEPVVISLLSDSEDEDEPSPAPRKFEPVPQPAPDRETRAIGAESVSDVAASVAADELLPDAEAPLPTIQTPVQQEADRPSTAAQEPTVAQPPQEVLDAAEGEPETAHAEAEDQEKPADKTDNAAAAADKTEADLLAEARKHAQEPTKSSTDATAPPAEPQQATDDDLRIDGKSPDQLQIVRSPKLATADAQDGVIPTNLPTVVRFDEGVSEDKPVLLSSQIEDMGKQGAGEIGESLEQMRETEIIQRHRSPAADDVEDETMIMEQLTQEQQNAEAEGQMRSHSPSPDISVHLARQAVAAKRHKKAPEPNRTSPIITRARSSSLRSDATRHTPEREEDESVNLARAALASPSKREDEEDNCVSLARAALASPSKHGAVVFDGIATTGHHPTTQTITSLRADLTKRLRIDLPECIPLKSLAKHVDKFSNAIAVVTSQPTQPTRAKGGPREYFMSFHVTDPSAAPSAMVEVQLYRPHKDSLPAVKPGDVVLLQRFQVKALSKKGWGLRTGVESAWAVWDGGHGDGIGDVDADADGGSQAAAAAAAAPQIRGPPVEDWEGYVEYVRMLREWFVLVMGDEGLRGKLERADRKLVEAGGGGGR